MTTASDDRRTSVPPANATARAIGRRPRMTRFLVILVAITSLVHIPFVIAVAEAGTRLGWSSPWIVAWSAGLFGIALFVSRARAGAFDRPRGRLGPMLIDIPYFIHWCACMFALVPSALSLLVMPVVCLVRGVPITFPHGFYMWTYAVGFVVSAYGVLVRRKWFVVEDLDVFIKGLDPKFDGYTIAHLSDLHVGTMTTRDFALKWTRAANDRSPDMAVVTGDMVTSGTSFHEHIADVVGALRAKDGVYVAMGNHDYFGDGEPLITLIRAKGVTVLRNEGKVIERGGARVYLAAIDDTWTRRDDINAALREKPEGVPAILLAHDPERFSQAAERGVALTLSGHTHGGQIAVPFLSRWLSLAHFAHRFRVGLYQRGDSWLYVHPGLGTTGPPVRFGVAPAVVMVRLRAKA